MGKANKQPLKRKLVCLTDKNELIIKCKSLQKLCYIFAKLAAINFSKWRKTGNFYYLQKWNDAENNYFHFKLQRIVLLNKINYKPGIFQKILSKLIKQPKSFE